jgi:hypothetical protein
MPSQNDRIRGTFDRFHDDFFSTDRYSAEFFNHTQGTRDNLTDDFNGETRESIGTIQVEMVPPSIDSSVRSTGTSFSWDTSIRFPLDESVVGSLLPLGEDNQQATEIEIEDDQDSGIETYELHGYSVEKGSGMVKCRLKEK